MQPAIEVCHLTKRYQSLLAVNDVSFTIQQGEMFSLLGPNGAGKTTILSIIEGLRQPDEGHVQVLGIDVCQQPRLVKQRIGIQLQSTSFIPDLTVTEQIQLYGTLYGRSIRRSDAHSILERMALEDHANILPGKLSGGQKQRLALALAMVNEPEVIFLDEPTIGLDPQARYALWEIVRSLRSAGHTIVFTTHYLEEAEALSDRVGIIDAGRLIAIDTPQALIQNLGGMHVISAAISLPLDEVKRLPGVAHVESQGTRLKIHTTDISQTKPALVQLAANHSRSLDSLHVQQPSLEDVFLSLTGNRLREN